ncbi:hypothetical protein HYU17_00750 [Candidatus Woesearchaeota archaeon]|nr:hypothetical protein [Candidatus Woesearchaeota archaeon]
MKKALAALAAVLVLGTIGYVLIEKMPFQDALLSAASVMATEGTPQGLSTPGKLFTTALIIASVAAIVAAVVKFLNPPVEGEEEALTGFFSSAPQKENLIIKEFKANKGSPLAGLQKRQILEKFGAVVVGVKSKGGFDIDTPLTAKIKSGSNVLLLGSPAVIMGVERKRK